MAKTQITKFVMKSSASAERVNSKKQKLLEEYQGLTLARALEIAENCETVGTQLAVMTIEEKGGNSASVNCIEATKRVHGKTY